MNIRNLAKYSILVVGSLARRNRGSKILYYHDIFSTRNYLALDAEIFMGTPLELFKEHVRVIREEGFEIVREITQAEGQVAIMLDDGFRGIYECREYFYENGICPTIFLPVDFIGRTDLGIMTEEEILELQAHGFRFESHTWSHRALTSVPAPELAHELADAREKLSGLLGRKVKGLCMPLGFFSDQILAKIRQNGYTDIYSCIPGNFNDRPLGSLIPRNLCQYATPREVRLILRGGNELLKSHYLKLHRHAD